MGAQARAEHVASISHYEFLHRWPTVSIRNVRGRIDGMLTIWRRHTASCPYRTRGRNVLKCSCPLWADGYVDGKRVLRQSLGTRDMARARKHAVALESPDAQTFKPVTD